MRTLSTSILLLALAASAPALAQPTPAFTYATEKEREEAAKAAAAAKLEWKATAQAGLIITAGNARMTAMSAGLSASRKQGMNRLMLDGSAQYARSSIFLAVDGNGDGAIQEDEVSRPSTTTNKGWASKARYDRFLTTNNSLYAAALAAADEPSGKELVAGGQVGYSRQLFKSVMHLLVAEAGYDFSYEDPTVGDGAAIHSGRLFAGYLGKLSDDTGLEGSVETLLNVNSYDTAVGEVDPFEDTRVTSKVALSTSLYEDVTFRFAVESKLDNAPSPRPAFAIPYAAGFVPVADELDTKVEATLIVNLL